MADVQLENGYTRIANEILENMARIKLSPTQYRLIFVIWRHTYGFKRKEHDMSLSFLAEATGCDKRSIQRELKRLEERKIIFQNIKDGSYRKISFNKDYEQWDSTIGETTIGNSANGEIAIGETANPTIGKTTNGTIGETANQERNKEIYKEIEEDEEENPIELFEKNFGIMTPFQMESIWEWVDDFNSNKKIVCLAIKEAALINPRNPFKYLNRILSDWHRRKLLTVEDVLKDKQKFEQSKVVNFNKRKTANEIDWDNL